MQQITLSGFLGADAVVRKTDSGAEFLTFNLCCRDNHGTSTFYPCTSFQTKGRFPAMLVKGAALIVTGELQITDTEKDGKKYKNFRVSADHIWFAPQQKAQDGPDAPSEDLPE